MSNKGENKLSSVRERLEQEAKTLEQWIQKYTNLPFSDLASVTTLAGRRIKNHLDLMLVRLEDALELLEQVEKELAEFQESRKDWMEAASECNEETRRTEESLEQAEKKLDKATEDFMIVIKQRDELEARLSECEKEFAWLQLKRLSDLKMKERLEAIQTHICIFPKSEFQTIGGITVETTTWRGEELRAWLERLEVLASSTDKKERGEG